MSRPRLMTTNGCTMCRRRRKKCCETRPVCSSCHRHSLPCFWNKLPNGRTRAEAEFVFSEDSNDADTFNSISRVLQTAQCFPALSTTFSNALDEHIIASSSRDGWTTTSRRLTLDPQWTPLSCLDHELARLKHSPFCRVTALWIARVVSKYTAALKVGLSIKNIDVPRFYLLTSLQTVVEYPSLIDYLPWPNVRTRLILQQHSPFSRRAVIDLILHGWRLGCSGEVADHFQWNTNTCMYEACSSFKTLVHDLHTFRLSHDFLNKYPMFRGDAPQFEPSLTFQNISGPLLQRTTRNPENDGNDDKTRHLPHR